jgi:hypothetical protein
MELLAVENLERAFGMQPGVIAAQAFCRYLKRPLQPIPQGTRE